MTTKKCRKCEESKNIELFYSNGKYINSFCIECDKARKALYRKNNKTKIDAWQKIYRSENKRKINAKNRVLYLQNKESVCNRTKKYKEENSEWYRKYKREYYQNPKNKLIRSMRRGVWGCLCGKQKTSRTFDYIGCTVEELWKHLESQFIEGMTRDNYGEWHVDHVKPIDSFDFDTDLESELCKAWHYSNLQPLWAKDNLSKGKRIEDGSA